MRTLKEVRVLIVGWKPNTNQFLRDLLASLGAPAFTRVLRTDQALSLLREQGFELVLCTSDAEPMPPAEFTKAVRRDVYARDPTIPVVVITAGVTLNDIRVLRDAGADDIMCPPMSADALEKRFERILLTTRSYVKTASFAGPDRRRAGNRGFTGQDRRGSQETIFYQPPRIRRD